MSHRSVTAVLGDCLQEQFCSALYQRFIGVCVVGYMTLTQHTLQMLHEMALK